MSAFPEKIEGAIFTEIDPKLTPEINSKDLIKLGVIVRKKGYNKKYEPLTDSLRKIQWVKICGLRAIAIEKEITSKKEPNVFVFAPSLQVAHSLNVTDIILHSKSALDSIAVFLTDLLTLGETGGDRDLKKKKFRDDVLRKDPSFGLDLMEFEPWLNELQNIRDEWIHRTSIRVAIIQGKSEIGALPIPKDVTKGVGALDLELNKQNFWSTEEFVNIHYSNLTNLFQKLIVRCIEIESMGLSSPVTINYDESKLGFFPTRSTENITPKTIRFYNP